MGENPQERIFGFLSWLEEIYKDIHRHPELGMKEKRTTALVKSVMSELGVEEVELPEMDVGAVCLIRGVSPGPTLAIRADMDALPIWEETGLPYSSEEPGTMHACGHDLNTAVLLGVLRYAVHEDLSSRMKGNLKFVFQPAEETLSGADKMIAAGVLENPHVDMILMSHGDPDLKVGEVGLFEKYSHANADHFFIELKGKGGHGSRPYQTQDLILSGAYLVNIFQSIVSRDLDARDAAVLSVCSFNAGSASNILPSTAKLTGTVRSLVPAVQEVIMRRMKEACDAVAELFHMEVILDYQVGVPSCVIDDAAESLIRDAALSLLPKGSVRFLETRMGGEDFAFYSKRVPAGVMRLGITPPNETRKGSTHSPTFQVDLAAIPVGVSILSKAVERYLCEGIESEERGE